MKSTYSILLNIFFISNLFGAALYAAGPASSSAKTSNKCLLVELFMMITVLADYYVHTNAPSSIEPNAFPSSSLEPREPYFNFEPIIYVREGNFGSYGPPFMTHYRLCSSLEPLLKRFITNACPQSVWIRSYPIIPQVPWQDRPLCDIPSEDSVKKVPEICSPFVKKSIHPLQRFKRHRVASSTAQKLQAKIRELKEKRRRK